PENGLFVTTNAGTVWQQVSAIPPGLPSNGEWPGITGIVFDSNSGTTDGQTNTLYVSSYGNGVWRTTNAGASWTQVSGGGLGGPSTVGDAIVAAGVYYATSDEPQNKKPNGVWRYSDGSWQDINPGNQFWHSIASDPFDANRLLIGSDGGYVNVSHDRGATWD